MRVELKTTFYCTRLPDVTVALWTIHMERVDSDILPREIQFSSQYRLLEVIQRMGELLGKRNVKLLGYGCSRGIGLSRRPSDVFSAACLTAASTFFDGLLIREPSWTE